LRILVAAALAVCTAFSAPRPAPAGLITSARLRAELSSLLASTERGRHGHIGLYVYSLRSGRGLYAHNADRPFKPASNAKIVVSVAALWLLGPSWRFRTEFYADAPLRAGVLEGDLYVKGYGDPTVDADTLEAIALEFRRLGVVRIEGSIKVDETYFDGKRFGPGWKPSWRGVSYGPPVSALSFNLNTVEMTVHPTRPGQRPRVELEPPATGLVVKNHALTRRRGGRLKAVALADGRTIVLKGALSVGGGYHRVTLAVREPALYFGGALLSRLRGAGIEVEGGVTKGAVPAGARNVYTHYSDTLASIVREYNKRSLNIVGENLIKAMGAEFAGPPGSWEKGARVIGEFLERAGLSAAGIRLVDGSGLSLRNRVTPRGMVKVLEFAYRNERINYEFMKSLSIGGVDGTLSRRFRASAVEGRVLAKTGYIRGVHALSGYLFTRSGDVVAFSLLVNGVAGDVKELQQGVLDRLVECCSDTYAPR